MRALLLLAFAALPNAYAQTTDVLLLTGANNHDWEYTSAFMANVLRESGRFDVTVATDPAAALTGDLSGVDVFLLDYNGPRWGSDAETAFLEAVRGGTGVVVVHAANNAFPGWTEYEQLVGLLWREGTGHGRFHAFDLEVTDRAHPVTALLPSFTAHPDELYHRLANPQGVPNRVLASAYSDPATGGTGEHEPMIVARSFGQGRVLHTPLGHVWRGVEATHASWDDRQLQNLLVRAVDWAADGVVIDGSGAPNRLTALERAAGWQLLFDGETTDGWTSYGKDPAPEAGWAVVQGCLVHTGGGGNLVTREHFLDFELELEWKVAAGANSGIKYRVFPAETGRGALGPEYQILDDVGHQDGGSALSSAGALYALYPPSDAKELALLGSFNRTRIRVQDGRVQHWLNDRLVVDAVIGSDDWNERIARSKFANVEGYGLSAGPILLQDHGDEVWYRDIKIRSLDRHPEGERVELVDLEGGTLDGWIELGDAVYTVEDGGILGAVGGGGQSFLATERSFGDFVLEVDVKTEEKGNSGIQVRSWLPEKWPMAGYQIEIDPSDRAWSGGLYEEGARGWLDPLDDNPDGRAAFHYGEWNRFRIECIGPSVRTWVNGVPCADYLDGRHLSGRIGLQVHSGNNTRVRWANLELTELGESVWEPVPTTSAVPAMSIEGAKSGVHLIGHDLGDFSARFSLRTTTTAWIGLGRGPLRPKHTLGVEGIEPRPDEGWVAAIPGSGEERKVTVHVHGDRVAILVDGALLHDRSGLPGPGRGSVSLMVTSSYEVSDPEFLTLSR